MRLSGLTLETAHFEDYLSFLTEVMELEFLELTEISMKFRLESGAWLEILKVPSSIISQGTSNVEFELTKDELADLNQKMSFFYYRNEDPKFICLLKSPEKSEIVDPDGRVWRFQDSLTYQEKLLPQTSV